MIKIVIRDRPVSGLDWQFLCSGKMGYVLFFLFWFHLSNGAVFFVFSLAFSQLLTFFIPDRLICKAGFLCECFLGFPAYAALFSLLFQESIIHGRPSSLELGLVWLVCVMRGAG